MVEPTVDNSPDEKGEGRWKREQGDDTWLKLGAFKERRQSHTP